jgi:ribonuclease BN (tRNA processing enzyme)
MNADVLIHDGQYTDEELKKHKGWGHSSYSQAIEVAERCNVKQLIITHHDPDHDDEFLKAMEKKCKERFRNLVFARDNYELSF